LASWWLPCGLKLIVDKEGREEKGRKEGRGAENVKRRERAMCCIWKVNSSIDWQVKAGEIIGLHHGLLESSGETERRVVEFHVCKVQRQPKVASERKALAAIALMASKR
jgi:hypothetical protein